MECCDTPGQTESHSIFLLLRGGGGGEKIFLITRQSYFCYTYPVAHIHAVTHSRCVTQLD